MAGRRPTLADVARHAEVSVPTVSKVLNGRSDVADDTRERIVEAMHALGYSHRAPSQPKTRAGVIDLLIGGLGSLWAAEIVRGAEQSASRLGLSLVVTSAGHSHFNLSRWLEALVAHRSEGVIVVTARPTKHDFEQLHRLNIPIVKLDAGITPSRAFAQVGATNWAGGRDAAQHLIDLGHRRIGFIGGPEEVQVSHERQEGYSAALRRAGIEADPALVRHGDFMAASGEARAHELLDLDDPPTAIIASSDLEAMGVYHAAHTRGLRIPADLSVIGYDDSLTSEHLSPPLTTVRQPLAEMADHAVRLVVEMGQGLQPAHPRVELATTLVLRESTGPAPRKATE